MNEPTVSVLLMELLTQRTRGPSWGETDMGGLMKSEHGLKKTKVGYFTLTRR